MPDIVKLRPGMRWIWVAALGAMCAWGSARAEAGWTLLRSNHFEVYSQSDSVTARAALTWFEELRTFFEQSGFRSDTQKQVRVIGFRSTKEYGAYRLRPGADAYYVGTGARAYIVMPSLGAAEFITAAHEYAHLQLHANGLKLPLWLDEGLAEFFSTVRIGQRECYVGGGLPVRVATLHHSSWMPLQELIEVTAGSAVQTDRGTAPLFYAESWALTEMLALSPAYAPRFRDVVGSVSSGAPGAETLSRIYGRSLNEIMADLRSWIDERKFVAVRLPGVTLAGTTVETRALSQVESSLALADLAMADGQQQRAEALYRQLAEMSPTNPEICAALGAIAMRRGDTELARRNWKRAIDAGIKDAHLCYRYATLEEDAGMAADEIRPVLQRAIELEPGFDDARYKLALLENNAGRFEEGLVQLQAMREVAPGRGFGYWSARSYAFEELGRREEAQHAAERAFEYASTREEREHARTLAYMAATDFAVQFTRDASGKAKLATTRVPHNLATWNPFVEPGDRMRRVEGQLEAINCDAGKATGVVIESTQGLLQLAITDPTQVEMRNAPREFICGSQTARNVSAEYAASPDAGDSNAGVLRGLEFH